MISVTAILALFMLAVAIRSSLRLMYGMRRAKDGDVLHSLLLIISWTCMVSALIGASLLFLWLFAIPLWIFIGVTLLTAFVRHRHLQQKALLAMLATVSEKNLPPVPALQAFADGHPGEIGRAASRMAEAVNKGALLSGAITLCERALPRFTRVFVQSGAASGNVVPAIREVNQLKSPGHIVAQTLSGRLFYLFFVGYVWLSVGTFTMLWIVPKFFVIFDDFDVELPDLTIVVMVLASWCADFWFLLLPFVLLFCVIPCVLMIYWKLYDFHWISGVPIVERWDTSMHRAVILRSLAIAAERNQPLGPVLRSLSMNYPRAFIGRRLWNVAGDVEAGGCWYESMRHEKLLRSSDVAVLRSAERAGNLAWAMRMVAKQGVRRSVYRMQALLNWVSPLVVMLIGLGVMLFVVGLFLPLVNIIYALSP